MQITTSMRVTARGLTWDVMEQENLGGQERLRLRCLTDDLQGLEWDLLRPHETVEPQHEALDPTRPDDLAAWHLLHQAYLLEQIPGPSVIAATAPGRIKIEPYQLVPLMRALELPRPRLLLADGVGLGKTVQAGLIAAELIARRRAHRILVITPAGPLLRQWEQEMRHRFGLRFTVLADATALRGQQRALEWGGNPFGSSAFVLTSLDFAKQDAVLRDLERVSWDLVILDEAHHCVSAAPIAREDTQRRRLAEVVARQSDGLLLLTATPHDGYDPHFASLMALLDPSLVDAQGALAGRAWRRQVVRRLKSHITDPATGRPLFRPRHVTPVPITPDDPAVLAFHKALSALIAPRLTRATMSKQFADALAFVSLLKRSVSTIAACVATLRVVADRYTDLAGLAETDAARRERGRTLRAYRRQALRFGVLDAQSETDVERLEAEDIAAGMHAAGDTETSLRRLIYLGEQAAPADPKLPALINEIRLIRAREPRANVLVYTEYADSQVAAAMALRAARGMTGEILTIGGQDSEDNRARAAERCAETDDIVLISTDSMAEGLNLQQRCHHLIHLDLPYNPNRLEQRNGRIDRYGQTKDPEIRYLCLAGTFEERLLLRLIGKFEKARAQLTFMPDTLGITAAGITAATDRLGEGLLAGLAEEQASLFPDQPPPLRTLDIAATEAHTDAYRELLREIDRAYEGFDAIAVRHGWFDGQGVQATTTQMRAATEAGDRARLQSRDLTDFVTAAVGAISTSRITIPPDWAATLAGLPGYDPACNILRVTRDPLRSRDDEGASLAFLGRAHPAVRKAIGLVRRQGKGRVAVAQHDQHALVLTYTMEIPTQLHVAFQHIIAVLLPERGPPRVVDDVDSWLTLGVSETTADLSTKWRHFEQWAPHRLPEAEAAAMEAMRRITTTFTTEYADHAAITHLHMDRWLASRAEAICGPRQPNADDLFSASASGPAWRHAGTPIERLSHFITDSTTPTIARRDAEAALFHYRHQHTLVLGSPILHRLGLLMLVPSA